MDISCNVIEHTYYNVISLHHVLYIFFCVSKLFSPPFVSYNCDVTHMSFPFNVCIDDQLPSSSQIQSDTFSVLLCVTGSGMLRSTILPWLA